MGGGSFFSSLCGDVASGEEHLSWLPLRSRPNQPLARFDLRVESAILPAPRLCGRSPFAPAAAACVGFSRPRLNSRRMEPGRAERVGEVGTVEASLVASDVGVDMDCGEETSGFEDPLALSFAVSPFSSFGVPGSLEDGSSCMGEGSGGGMLVPSVNEPKLRSRAGSSKRLTGATVLVDDDGVGEEGDFVFDGIGMDVRVVVVGRLCV
mgnify:CR=1 FL=1